jgi:hypothetical protein
MDMVKPDASKFDANKKIDANKPISAGDKPAAKFDKPGLDTKATVAKPGAAPMASKPAVQSSK